MGYGPAPSGVRTFDRSTVPSRIGVATSFCLVNVHAGFSVGADCWAPPPRCASPALAESDTPTAAATGKRYRPRNRRETDGKTGLRIWSSRVTYFYFVNSQAPTPPKEG